MRVASTTHLTFVSLHLQLFGTVYILFFLIKKDGINKITIMRSISGDYNFLFFFFTRYDYPKLLCGVRVRPNECNFVSRELQNFGSRNSAAFGFIKKKTPI